jgi:hypothetical protein
VSIVVVVSSPLKLTVEFIGTSISISPPDMQSVWLGNLLFPFNTNDRYPNRVLSAWICLQHFKSKVTPVLNKNPQLIPVPTVDLDTALGNAEF